MIEALSCDCTTVRWAKCLPYSGTEKISMGQNEFVKNCKFTPIYYESIASKTAMVKYYHFIIS